MKFYELMKNATEEVGMSLSNEQYDKFMKYMSLIQEWNEKVNLTAITEDEEFVKKHFIDCIKAYKSDENMSSSLHRKQACVEARLLAV